MKAIGVSMVVASQCIACQQPAPLFVACPGRTTPSTDAHAGQTIERFCRDGSGRRHGPYAKVTGAGGLIVQGWYSEDRPVGGWTWYHSNGRPQRIGEYVAEGLHGPVETPVGTEDVVRARFRQAFSALRKVGWWVELSPRGETVKLGYYVGGELASGDAISSPLEPTKMGGD